MYFRAPRTTQEKRYDALFHTQLAEIERNYGPVRSRLRNGRGGYGLPTTYDDIMFKTQRTWKKTRRTQYRHHETLCEEGEVFSVLGKAHAITGKYTLVRA